VNARSGNFRGQVGIYCVQDVLWGCTQTGSTVMWVIVAVSLGFSDTPKLSVVPGPEFQSEAECVKATRVKGRFDSEKGGGGLEFSFCVPKDSVQIGKPTSPEAQ